MTVTKLAFLALTVLCLLGTPAQAHDLQSAAGSGDGPCPPIQIDPSQPGIYIQPECLDGAAAGAARQI